MESIAVTQFTTLGHPQRLAVFRLLMRHYPEPMAAGDIGAALGIKPSTLSVYLGALRHAGLITQERLGTSLRYQADLKGTETLVGYLVDDCCRARPQVCPPQPPAQSEDTDRPLNVLFLCSGNSARSIMAEAILPDHGPQFRAFSAGLRPSRLNPDAVALLEAKGHPTGDLRSKHISEFQGVDAPQMDFVFTVCDQAANEECPAWAGQPISGHWGQPDPVSAADPARAFQAAYATLQERIAAFAALPFSSLDRRALQARIDDISQMRLP